MSKKSEVYIPQEIVYLFIENSLINEHPIIAKNKLFLYQQVSKEWREVCLMFLKKKVHTLKFEKDSFIDLNQDGLNLKEWTVEMWIKKESSNSPSVSILNSYEFALKLEQFCNTKLLGITKYGKFDKKFDYKLKDNKWVHLTLSHDKNSDTRFYINGKHIDTIRDIAFSVPLGWIGGEGLSVNQKLKYGFVGEILEFKVWRITKSSDEILKGMYDTYPKDKYLLFYMMFGEGEIINFCDKEKLKSNNVQFITKELKDFLAPKDLEDSYEKVESQQKKKKNGGQKPKGILNGMFDSE